MADPTRTYEGEWVHLAQARLAEQERTIRDLKQLLAIRLADILRLEDLIEEQADEITGLREWITERYPPTTEKESNNEVHAGNQPGRDRP